MAANAPIFIIKCPRDWTQVDFTKLEDGALCDYMKPFLPGVHVTKVIRKNRPKKPYCLWEVQFTYYHTSANGAYKAARRHVDTFKPRNSVIHNCDENGSNNYTVEYRITSCLHSSFDFHKFDNTEQRQLKKKIRVTLIFGPNTEIMKFKINSEWNIQKIVEEKLGWDIDKHEVILGTSILNFNDKLIDHKVRDEPLILKVQKLQ